MSATANIFREMCELRWERKVRQWSVPGNDGERVMAYAASAVGSRGPRGPVMILSSTIEALLERKSHTIGQ